MHWIAPSEKDTANAALLKRLWDAANQFRADTDLKSQEYSGPILGIIFLRFAEVIEPYHGRILTPACGMGGMFDSSTCSGSEHERQV